eukprot:CAMPEP_0202507080 /NCGR_PEP_ID=MMETSP1361-20130828/51532_1 /ASSEMBLY_ACC=CAM_ASM_000849 /TAXON_ID=210615 /ORGANISM="Staurosira complex sp., Strain CCMP2646" /LENGTH=924 /DNA_ID=CAMNT_0049141177 /DNA_START=60 /DNA_END=2834 /DNA_ORIENTATION=-
MDLNQISADLVNLVFYGDGETKEAVVSHHDDPKPPPFQAHFQSSDSPSLFAGGDTSLAHQNQKEGGGKQNASTLGTKSDISSKTIPKGKQISWFGQSKSKTKQGDSVKSVKSLKSTFSHLSMLNRRQRFKAGKSKGGRSKISTLLRKTRTTKKGTSVAKSWFSKRSKLTSRSEKDRRSLKKLSDDVQTAINLLWSKRYGEKALMMHEDAHSVPSAIRLKQVERPVIYVVNGGGFQGCCFADSVMDVLTDPSIIYNPVALAPTFSDVSLNEKPKDDDTTDLSTLANLRAGSGRNRFSRKVDKRGRYDDQGTLHGTIATIATERDGNWIEQGATRLLDDTLDIILGQDPRSTTKKRRDAGSTRTGNDASLKKLRPKPSSWKAVVDKETGRTYYCRVTRETTWTKPKDLALGASTCPMGGEPKLGDEQAVPKPVANQAGNEAFLDCELTLDDGEDVPKAVVITAGNESSPSGEQRFDDREAVPNAVDKAGNEASLSCELKLNDGEAVPKALINAAGNESSSGVELNISDGKAVPKAGVNIDGNEASLRCKLKLDDGGAVPKSVVNTAGNESSPSGELKLDDGEAVPKAVDNTAGNEASPRTSPQKPVWEAIVDKESGRTYYFHRVTREATWTKPKDLALKASRSPMDGELKLDDGEAVPKAVDNTAGNEASPRTSSQKPVWEAVVDKESGRTYYFHRVTREATWTKPEDFVESKRPTFYPGETRHEAKVSKSNIVKVACKESSVQCTEVVSKDFRDLSDDIATQSTSPLDTSWDEDIHILNIIQCTSFDSSEELEVQVPEAIVGSSSVSAYSEASPISESSSDATKPKWKLLRWRRNTTRSHRKESHKEETEAPKPMRIEVVTKDNENQGPDKLSSRLLAEVEKRIDPTTEEDYSYTSGFEEQNGDKNDSFIFSNEWEFEQVLEPEK